MCDMNSCCGLGQPFFSLVLINSLLSPSSHLKRSPSCLCARFQYSVTCAAAACDGSVELTAAGRTRSLCLYILKSFLILKKVVCLTIITAKILFIPLKRRLRLLLLLFEAIHRWSEANGAVAARCERPTPNLNLLLLVTLLTLPCLFGNAVGAGRVPRDLVTSWVLPKETEPETEGWSERDFIPGAACRTLRDVDRAYRPSCCSSRVSFSSSPSSSLPFVFFWALYIGPCPKVSQSVGCPVVDFWSFAFVCRL